MRLVSYNILHGGLGRADPIAEILAAQRADVICLLEADDPDVVQRLARRLQMDFIHAPGRRHAGAILSRLPLRATWNESLRLEDFAATFLLAEIAAAGKGAGADKSFCVGAVHLHAHATLADEELRLREVDAILRVTANLPMPQLLAGDFNATSPTQKVDPQRCKPSTRKEWEANGGLLPREAISRLLAAGCQDTLHAVKGPAAAEMGTFSTHYPGQRVDFIFARGVPRQALRDAWIETDRLATYASDHYPVGAECDLL